MKGAPETTLSMTAAESAAVPLEPTITADGAATSTRAADALPPARYVVVSEFARGGLGRILRAHDELLDRPVAIKELLTAQDGATQERFQREAAITARLQHPAILPVYDAGSRGNGQPFYVMKLLSNGRTLKQAVAEASDLDARLALLPHLIAVADAIAYAHSLGIIHRDIKPSNVLLGPFGETVVIDWGLAKELSESEAAERSPAAPYRTADAEVTTEGTIVGTPAYMAPEQARGEAVGKPADVYALGALLYSVLAGGPPFSGPSLDVVRKLAAGARPDRLDERSGAPPDLIAIVDKAMQPDPAHRYAGAEALAEDLKRFQTGQLVGAHQYTSGALLRRWIRRNKLASAVTGIFLAILAVTMTVSIRRIRNERSVAVAERNRLILAQARSELDPDPTLAVEWLETYPLDGIDWDQVQILAADAQSRGIARHLLPTTSRSMDLFPDSRRLVVGGSGPEASVWDFVAGKRLRTRTFDSSVRDVAVSPDGETVAVTDRGGEVFVWTPRDDQLRKLGTYKGAALRAAFSRSGERLFSSSRDIITEWDVASGRQEASLHSPDSITTLRVAPDEDTVGFGTANGMLVLWQPATGSVRRLTGHVGALSQLAFSRDGKRILTGGSDHTVRLWQRASGEGRILGAHDDIVRHVAFSPDETMAVTGGVDHKVRVWSLDGGRSRVLSGHTESIGGATFSADGRTIASCSKDRTIRLWDLATGDDRVLRGANGDLGDVGFTRDGAWVISNTFDSHTRIWSVSDPPGKILGRHGLGARYVAVSPDSKWVAAADTEQFARLWDLASGQERPLPGGDYNAMELPAPPQFSADNRRLVAGGEGRVRVWDLTTGWTQQLVLDSGSPRLAILSADGRAVAIAATDDKLRIWYPETGEQQLLSSDGSKVLDLAFAYDHTLVALRSSGQLERWELPARQRRSLGRVAGEPVGLAITPDRHTVATSDARGQVELWDLAASAKVRTLATPGPPQRLKLLQFSGDGRELAAGGAEPTTRVWDLASGQSRALRSHDKLMRTIALSPDGRWLATGSEDRVIHIRDLRQGGFAVLAGHRGAVLSIAFSDDGKFLVSASEDGSVRRWQMDRVHFVPRERDALITWMKQQTTATLATTENVGSTTHQ